MSGVRAVARRAAGPWPRMVGVDNSSSQIPPVHATTPPAEVVLSREQAVASTRTVERGRVRVAKRVVVEERTVTVQVRREELVVEELPADPRAATAARSDGADGPVLELVLAEEEVQVVTRVVPRERVRVFLDTVRGAEAVSTTVAHEEVTVETEPLTGR